MSVLFKLSKNYYFKILKTTKNFNMFQISENNRQVDEKHVAKFVKEFEKIILSPWSTFILVYMQKEIKTAEV